MKLRFPIEVANCEYAGNVSIARQFAGHAQDDPAGQQIENEHSS